MIRLDENALRSAAGEMSVIDPREARERLESTVPTVWTQKDKLDLQTERDAESGSSSSIGISYLSQLLRIGVPLWIADVVGIVFASIVGLSIASLIGMEVNHPVVFTLFVVAICSASLASAGLYPGLGLHPARELKMLFRGSVVASLSMAFGLGLLTNWGSPYVVAALVGGILQLGSMPLLRGFSKSWMLEKGIGVPVAFLGEKESVDRICLDMKRFGNPMLKAVGRFSGHDDVDREYNFANSDSATGDTDGNGIPLLGSANELTLVSREHGINWLFVVGDKAADMLDANPSIVSDFPEVIVSRASRSQVCAGSSVVNYGLTSGIRLESARLLPWAVCTKRAIDIVVSAAALILLSPLLLFVAACIRLSGPGPLLYGSKRVGLGGSEIRAWKFRSMVANADEVLENFLESKPELRLEWERDRKLRNDPRITLIGRVIRKTSIDELPQLWNVLVGEMSLVGPRPMLYDEIEKYGSTYQDYLLAKPGITGLWQVSGRNQTSYQERLDYVEYYVRHWSPWMDFYILIRTVRTVLFCEGAC